MEAIRKTWKPSRGDKNLTEIALGVAIAPSTTQAYDPEKEYKTKIWYIIDYQKRCKLLKDVRNCQESHSVDFASQIHRIWNSVWLQIKIPIAILQIEDEITEKFIS